MKTLALLQIFGLLSDSATSEWTTLLRQKYTIKTLFWKDHWTWSLELYGSCFFRSRLDEKYKIKNNLNDFDLRQKAAKLFEAAFKANPHNPLALKYLIK